MRDKLDLFLDDFNKFVDKHKVFAKSYEFVVHDEEWRQQLADEDGRNLHDCDSFSIKSIAKDEKTN